MTPNQYLYDLWCDIAEVPAPVVETRDPETLRRHVAMPEAEAVLAESFHQCCDELAIMGHRAAGTVAGRCYTLMAEYANSTATPEVIMGPLAWVWRVLTRRSPEELLCALTARRVQGMFRYGDAWKTDYTAAGLVVFARGRLGRYLETGDTEQIVDTINILMMAWQRYHS
jgi:hypothetical protein